MKWLLVAVVLPLAVLGGALALGVRLRPLHRNDVEREVARQGQVLLHLPTGIPAGAAGRLIRLDLAALTEMPLYLTAPGAPAAWLTVDGAGAIRLDGEPLGQAGEWVGLLLTHGQGRLLADGRVVADNVGGWQAYRIAAAGGPVPAIDQVLPAVKLSDGFMRHELAGELCTLRGGKWELAQHGGGLPQTAETASEAHAARAVNPFTIRGADGGDLRYGAPAWFDYYAEARFYFGVPRQGRLTDWRTVPADTDMLIVQGEPDGPQAGFGWRGETGGFELLTRESAAGAWVTRARWEGPRPPLTNWVRIGLQVRDGLLAEGLLDGVTVAAWPLERWLSGGFSVLCGKGQAEADDVAAWSLSSPPEQWPEYLVKSELFSLKKRVGDHDPKEFAQWSSAADAFLPQDLVEADGTLWVGMVTSLPVIGPFRYEPLPASLRGKTLAAGVYRFELLRELPPVAATGRAALPFGEAAARIELTYDGSEWQIPAQGALPGDRSARQLTFGRDGDDSSCLWMDDGGQAVYDLSGPVPGPVYVRISQPSKPGAWIRRASAATLEDPDAEPTMITESYPRPELHVLRIANLHNEFFDQAATDWAWVEGAFRMDARWACFQDWNFMACGGTGVPWMSSRRTFDGDQVHQYYLSLRPVFPFDAGDGSFSYDPGTDTNWETFIANEGWYNRHDLNFSFCTDGLNPLSGYSIVFGGYDNRRTVLMRRGEVVQERREPSLLFPTEVAHRVIHWEWWRFTVTRLGGRLVVNLRGVPLFDYTDPEPLPGGHVGFWTVRNGFALSRVTSMAERVGTTPHLMYVPDDVASPWSPVIRDAVVLSAGESPGMTRVTAAIGAGFHGVRYLPDAPVKLRETPMLELPLKLDGPQPLHLYLEVDQQSYVIGLQGPLVAMKSLLTPHFERGECFRIPAIPEWRLTRERLLATADPAAGPVRVNLAEALAKVGHRGGPLELRSLTLGNTADPEYQLAGHRGTPAGAAYDVGVPVFTAGEAGDAAKP